MTDSKGREGRIRAIGKKLQELYDNARARCMQKHPKIHPQNIRTHWVFRDFVQFPFAQHDNTFPTPNDISNWPEWYLSRWHPLFPDGYIIAEAFVVHCSGGKVPSKDDVDQMAKNKLYSYVKERLKDAIEMTIGHDMYERAVQVNYCASDPEPPNSFKWVFSPDYPSFPSALSQFDCNDLYKCIEALENGHLRVTRVETAPLDETALANLERVGKIAKKGVPALIEEAEGMLKILEVATGRKEDVDDLPEVMEATSVIMEHWEWKFTKDYPLFHIAIRGGRKRRNRLADWPAAPLRELIYAIDMGHFKLIPRSKERSDTMRRSMKPKRADIKPPTIRRTRPKFSPDTDGSDSEEDDWNPDEHVIQDTPDSQYEYSQDNDSGDTIRVQPPLVNTGQHATKRNLPCLPSYQRSESATSNAPANGALKDNEAESTQVQQLFKHWLEKLSSVIHEDSETITVSLGQAAQDKVRLQQNIKEQREQIARNENEVLGQTLELHSRDETLRRLSQLLDHASSRLNGERQQDYAEIVDNSQSNNRGAVPDHNPKPSLRYQKRENDFEVNLQCLIGKFETRIDELVLEKDRNATVIAALVDQQTKLAQQLRDKEADVKKAEQRGRQEGKRLVGTNVQRKEEDPVLRFVAQYPVFDKDGKIRELQKIYKNWKDLPHNIFHEILPPGHDLSEVILGWIAKLSCILSSALVLSSFREEINHRTQYQPTTARSRTLTPDDVSRTLQKHGIIGEGNRNTLPPSDRRSAQLPGKISSIPDAVPDKSTVALGGKTNQRAENPQDKTTVKKPQSQMWQTSNGLGNLQYPPRINPPTAARNVSFATTSNSQGHKSEDNQLPQKRKDISVVIDSNASKRAKSNTSDYRSIYSPDNIP